MRKERIIPRGIRNNNPLNIRIGNVWLGEVPNPTDKSFEQFVRIEYGIRAACVILRRYIRRYGRNTITSIVSAWAPASENNTIAYIDKVAQLSKVAADAPIKYEDKETMCAIIGAMCFVENGQSVSEDAISKGYDMA